MRVVCVGKLQATSGSLQLERTEGKEGAGALPGTQRGTAWILPLDDGEPWENFKLGSDRGIFCFCFYGKNVLKVGHRGRKRFRRKEEGRVVRYYKDF